MENYKFIRKIWKRVVVLSILIPHPSSLIAGSVWAATPDLVAVSADIVEISGSVQTQKGFGWNQLLEFQEKEIPGIIRLGEFARKTALTTTLRLLETEGKAQFLANPKVITKSGTQANFVVGGEIPFPTVNNQGVGVDLKRFGIILNMLPVILSKQKETINVQLQLEVSNPDFSKPVTIQNVSVPSIITRQIQTEVELKSGETLVIGGLKRSTKNVTKTRVPFLGRIPLLGLLFTTSDILEDQSSLFLFVTVEMVK
ncbi:MAG: type II and III secretion system protein [Elusimicrobia bacterium]|nr:type II and III secretion system protein [Elusimicrobiota bacterium]